MATSVVRSDTPLGTFRLGIQRNKARHDALPALQPAGTVASNIGFGGPGGAALEMRNEEATGATSELLLTGAPPATSIWMVVGPPLNPAPFFGGLLAPASPTVALPFVTDGLGQLSLPVPGGGDGPLTLYLQAVLLDGSLPQGIGISNALRVDFLP